MAEFRFRHKSYSPAGGPLAWGKMREEFRSYLESIRTGLKLDPQRRREILREIYSHLEEKAEELCQEGVEQGEAARRAIQAFGFPQLIAKELYEANSVGSWRQAFLGALPHFLAAAVFAFHLWSNPLWLSSLALFTLTVSLYGWWHGKPNWLFPWLGYWLLPLLGVGFFLLVVPPWGYIGLLAYIPLAWKLFSAITLQAMRRDWLYATVTLLPFPVLLAWLVSLKLHSSGESLFQARLEAVQPWIALSFLTLGLAVISFTRLSARRLKTGALLTPELILLILIALSAKTWFGFLSLVLLALVATGVLVSPALLERRVSQRLEKWRDEEWPG